MVVLVLLIGLAVMAPAGVLAHDLAFENVSETKGASIGTLVGERGSPLAPDFLDNEGVYATDYNRDGWPDVLVTGGTSPVLLRNENGSFVRDDSFPDVEFKVNAALFMDYDQDGWPDLILVPKSGRIRLLDNRNGEFTVDRRLDRPRLSHAIGVTGGDVDQDGCPDLFVIQYNSLAKHDFLKLRKARRDQPLGPISNDNGRRNYLLRGNCDSFDVVEDPAFERTHWSLATSFADFNNDGLLDLHVANDFNHDSLYLNQGDFSFDHTYLPEYSNRNGMSSEVLDVNQDGRPDLFVSNILLERSSPIWNFRAIVTNEVHNPRGHNVLVNDGDGTFTDHADTLGVKKGGWGWAVSYGDFNNDWEQELVQARQNLLIPSTALRRFNVRNFKVAKFLSEYRNSRPVPDEVKRHHPFAGYFNEFLGYPAVWQRSGGEFHRLRPLEWSFGRLNTRGVVQLDYNRDGVLDLLFSQFDGPTVLFENQMNPSGNWIRFTVEKRTLGGSISVVARAAGGEKRTRTIPLGLRTDFQSQETPFYHLGLPEGFSVEKITVRWNDRTRRTREDVTPNQTFSIARPVAGDEDANERK